MHQHFSFMRYGFWWFRCVCAQWKMSLRGSSSCQLVDWEWEIKMRWDTHILENKPNSAINSTYVDEEKSDMVLKMHNVKKITCMLYSKCFKTSIITQPIPHPTITTNISLFYCSLSFIRWIFPKFFPWVIRISKNFSQVKRDEFWYGLLRYSIIKVY